MNQRNLKHLLDTTLLVKFYALSLFGNDRQRQREGEGGDKEQRRHGESEREGEGGG